MWRRALWWSSLLVLAPIGALVLVLRPAYRAGLRERLGGGRGAAPGAIWVHAASVGEALSAARLMAELRARGHAVKATTSTLAGRDLLRARLPDVEAELAPLDHPLCVDRALDRISPAGLVLVEAELWPGLITGASRRELPIALVSGRLGEASLERRQGLRWLLSSPLRRISCFGMRDAGDARRMSRLGVDPKRIAVTGDLKLDPPVPGAVLGEALGRALGGGEVVVAGSTHPGEEVLLLRALERVEAAGRRPLLVLAPRRPERADAIRRVAEEQGRKAVLRSALAGAALLPGQVLILDGLGELAALYGLATVSFVGGSLVPAGGHNLLEPVQAGSPLLFGPHVDSCRDLARALLDAGAALQVEDEASIASAVLRLLEPDVARAMRDAGEAMLTAHAGTVSRSADLVESMLGPART